MKHIRTFESLFDQAGIPDEIEWGKLSEQDIIKQFPVYIEANKNRLDISKVADVEPYLIGKTEEEIHYNLEWDDDMVVEVAVQIDWNFVSKTVDWFYSIDLSESADLTEGQVAQYVEHAKDYYVQQKDQPCSDMDMFLETIERVIAMAENASTNCRVEIGVL